MFIYPKNAIYALERCAVEQDCLPEIELMERAGSRVWAEIGQRWPELSRITIIAGSGNNGGDAYVVAIQALRQCLEVQLIGCAAPADDPGAAAMMRKLWLQVGGEIETWQQQSLVGELIVDGLFGIGLNRDLEHADQQLIHCINACPVPRVAIDIPSGLNADTGIAQPIAVQAELCVTFIAAKQGQYLADGPDYCGELLLDQLGISARCLSTQEPGLVLLDKNNMQLPAARRRNSHKHQFGHVLVIGGEQGMAGAAVLAGQGALRAGAGLVSLLVQSPDQFDAWPELMVHRWDSLEGLLEQASVILVGPGLGHSAAAQACLDLVAATSLPLVVDASALTAKFLGNINSDQLVFTPHPGEAAGLLSISSKVVQTDRVATNQALSERFGGVSVLKGSGSLVHQKGCLPALNAAGHPGMATAGSGDVLAGIIAGLLAQQLSPFEAAKTGVGVHALAAQAFADAAGENTLVASDILQALPAVLGRLYASR